VCSEDACTPTTRHVVSSCMRQHTSTYVHIRQHMFTYVIRAHQPLGTLCPPACVSIRHHTSAYVIIRQHTSAYVPIRQNMSAYVMRARQAQQQSVLLQRFACKPNTSDTHIHTCTHKKKCKSVYTCLIIRAVASSYIHLCS
jgi:hypothetical protein